MKLFQLEIPDCLLSGYKPVSVKYIICEKAWKLINDERVKQVLIFKDNGEMLLSSDGEVSNGSWTYIISNQALILSFAERSTMFHPIYADEVLIAFQQDGKTDTLFLIADISPNSHLNTKEDLESYLRSKEYKYHLAKQKEQQEEAARKKEEEERKKAEEEGDLQRLEEARKASAIRRQAKSDCGKSPHTLFIILFVSVMLYTFIPLVFLALELDSPVFIGALLAGMITIMLFGLASSVKQEKNMIEDYIIERRVALITLRENDYQSYSKAERQKSIPFIIRSIDWLIGILGTTITSSALLPLEEDHKWWQFWGILLGLSLGYWFWVWLGRVLARRVERTLFGRQLD